MLDQSTDLKSLLKDPSLLVEAAYLAGEWVEGDEGTFDVTNPATLAMTSPRAGLV